MLKEQKAIIHRPLFEIATEIRQDWRKQHKSFNFAEPYRAAMADLTHISDMYGADTACSVVLYFLSNATTWRGDTARKIKDELRQIVRATGYKL